MSGELKLGLNTGYWAGGPPPGVTEAIAEAERLGFDSMWTAEAYGSDCLTPLAWWGSQTERIKLGTGIVQMSARQPAATAMAAMTMDHLSGGRFILGLGVSGPQVVEGWYGMPFAKPLARTREYVGILRDIWARQGPVTADGPHYPLPLPDGTGLGKPLKASIHPLREDIPIYLAAEGPKNIALAAEICDGWVAMLFSPKHEDMYREALNEGFAREGARRSAGGLRGRRDGPVPRVRRRPGRRRRAAPLLRPLLRRHGGEGEELPRERGDPDGLRVDDRRGAGALPERQEGRGRRRHPVRADRGAVADRPGGQDPRRRAAWRESIVTTLLIAGDANTVRQAAEIVLD